MKSRRNPSECVRDYLKKESEERERHGVQFVTYNLSDEKYPSGRNILSSSFDAKAISDGDLLTKDIMTA